MLFLGLSVPGEVPRCSASVLVLLAGFLNSGFARDLHEIRQAFRNSSGCYFSYMYR